MAHPLVAVASVVAWMIPMLLIKLRLMDASVLTSDIAYYGNMLHNTGFDPADGVFRILYTTHDVLRFSSTSFLTEHFSPTFALLAPLYQLLPNPLFLTLAQPLLIGIAGIGLFELSKSLIKRYDAPPAACFFPVAFLAAYLINTSNIPTTADSIYGFHHDSLIPPLMVWGLKFALDGRWRVATACLLLLLGVKENLPIVVSAFFVACLPFGWLVPRRRSVIGIVLCILVFVGCYWFQFRTENRHVSILYRFFDLDSIAAALGNIDRWPLVIELWPAWLTLPILLPASAEFSLQLMGATVQYDWHSYPLMMLAFIGTLISVTKAITLAGRYPRGALALTAIVLGLLITPIVAAGLASYRSIDNASRHLTPLVDLRALERITPLIPENARLLTTSDLLVYFSDRRHLLWPESAGFADHILVNHRTPEENSRLAEAFNLTLETDDGATRHFYGDIGIVLSGYLYDSNAVAYVERRLADGTATLIKRDGALALYALQPDANLPDIAASTRQ